MHRTYMGGLERGERNLTLRTVERIAQRIEVEALTLLEVDTPIGAVKNGREGTHGQRRKRARRSEPGTSGTRRAASPPARRGLTATQETAPHRPTCARKWRKTSIER